MSNVHERAHAHLDRVKLKRVAELLDPIAEQATKEKLSSVEVLDRLLEAEAVDRAERRLLAKTRLAHFPFIKTLADFDFGFQPWIDRELFKLACPVSLAVTVGIGGRIAALQANLVHAPSSAPSSSSARRYETTAHRPPPTLPEPNPGATTLRPTRQLSGGAKTVNRRPLASRIRSQQRRLGSSSDQRQQWMQKKT
jgi:IstB-like ATP binding protein